VSCRHAAECGGCGWLHLGYPEQLEAKRRTLEGLLRAKLGPRAPRVAPMIGMPVGADGMPWAFRQKAAFVFGRGPDGGLTMGHFARGTNDVIPVSECPVHAARANRIAFALRDELVRSGLSAWDGRGGVLRHLLVRVSADGREAVAVLVVTQDDKRLREPLRRLMASPARPTGLMLNVHDRPGPYLVGRESLRIAGVGHVREDALGPTFLVSPTGFFQTNVAAAAELVRLVGVALPRHPRLRVLELYAGSGLFALPLARAGHSVVAVEESRKATRDAARNAKRNGVPESRLRLVPSRVEQALPRLLRERFDAVILDPPREGCPEAVLRGVAERLAPPRLVLVSCNPEALARELELLQRAGYRASLVQPVDMFPHTPHIEAVAVLQRPARPRPRTRAGIPGSRS
jgi:23S rRNA (uracil1939-C5)-methyltransferase